MSQAGTLAVDLEAFAAAQPGAYRLAALSSLASRVEPQLLRSLRLRLAGDVDPGAEADLWFSSLVEMRAATGIVLKKEVLPRLRHALQNEFLLLERAWDVTSEAHRHGSPALLAEEELAYLSLRGIEAPDIRWRATEILRRLVAGIADDSRSEIVNWAARAMVRLPSALFDIEEARMLALGAAYRGARLPEAMQRSAADGWDNSSWLRPSGRAGIKIGVRLVEGGVEFGPPAMAEAHVIDIPAIKDCTVELLWDEGDHHYTHSFVPDPARTQFAEMNADECEISVSGGERYRLSNALQRAKQLLRPPRVQITYEVLTYNQPTQIELPFVTGVIADLSGNVTPNRPPLADRKFVPVNLDNLDAVMARLAPALQFIIADSVDGSEDGRLAIALSFSRMTDFEPGMIARNVPALAEILESRSNLALLASVLDAKQPRMGLFTWDEATRTAIATDDSAALSIIEGSSRARDDFGDDAPKLVSALRLLVARMPAETTGNPVASIQPLIGELDRQLSVLVDKILKAPEFQQLERAWRGLAYLVNNTETDAFTKIRVFDATKREVAEDLANPEWDQCVLFKNIYESEFGQLGGEPFGLIVADFAFSHSSGGGMPSDRADRGWSDDVAILRALGRIGAAASCPILAAADPRLGGMETWSQLADARDIEEHFDSADHTPWKAMRDEENSRYLGLCMPRVLARLPYGSHSVRVADFDFDETVDPSDPEGLCWMNAAYAMAVNVNRAYKKFGWSVQIEGPASGGGVINVPVWSMAPDRGAIELRSCTELALGEGASAKLAGLGLTPVTHKRGQGGYFATALSLYRPKLYDQSKATASDRLSARLRYIFAASRFVHYVKCIARDKVGSFKEKSDVEIWMQEWLNRYVDGDPQNSTQVQKARRPLAGAKIEVFDGDSNSSYLEARIHLRPHFQLEGADIEVSAVTRLPGLPPSGPPA
ncbi:type VI secretion system contractile sheath large subunit [Mesorhizobium sp. GbtcB19]|uniref:type VI secretion system contractile sheath large subunit n=1 Tax=Mesorhizobium sp. GbtcB19 TaxID=2824764 RepID=UPI001C2FA7A4|nr:type VI secretion system contractile sheath large subunit [Mesorhizobium sp. GbtcB19]